MRKRSRRKRIFHTIESNKKNKRNKKNFRGMAITSDQKRNSLCLVAILAVILMIFFVGRFSLKAETGMKLVNAQGESIKADYAGWAYDKNVENTRYWVEQGCVVYNSKIYDSDSGQWYYVNDQGSLYKEGFLAIEELNEYVYCDQGTGVIQRGVWCIDGDWYRFDEETGNMIRGVYDTEGESFYYDVTTGKMQIGFTWIEDADTAVSKLVYYDRNGEIQTGQCNIDGNWYCFDEETAQMIRGAYTIDGNTYYYDPETGVMQTGFIIRTGDDYEGCTIYCDPDTGIMQTGRCLIDGNSYCFDGDTGNMIFGRYEEDGNTYYFDDSTGVMLTGECFINGNGYYFDYNTGVMQKGIVELGGIRYLYDEETGAYVRRIYRYFDAYDNIACWGDSMTRGYGTGEGTIQTESGTMNISGMGYPEALQSMTGIETYNYGKTGADSDNIMNTAMSYYYNNDVEELLIIEMGSNGGWNSNYDELISQYWAVINAAQTSRYIIVGDTDDPGTSIADYNQGEINGGGDTLWEQRLAQEFGSHFINMRQYMIQNGLSDCNMTPDDQDRYDQSMGRISEKLRSDWTHFNAYGYYSQAKGIYQKGAALGYWN